MEPGACTGKIAIILCGQLVSASFSKTRARLCPWPSLRKVFC